MESSSSAHTESSSSANWNYGDDKRQEFLSIDHQSNRLPSPQRGWRPRNQRPFRGGSGPPDQFFRHRSPQRGLYSRGPQPGFFRGDNRFRGAPQRGFSEQRPHAGYFNQQWRGGGTGHHRQYDQSSFPYFHPSMLEDPWAPRSSRYNQNDHDSTAAHIVDTPKVEVANDDPELQDILQQMQQRKEADESEDALAIPTNPEITKDFTTHEHGDKGSPTTIRADDEGQTTP